MSGLGKSLGSRCKRLRAPLSCRGLYHPGQLPREAMHHPFKYDNQWFHGCTSTSREDGHLWCATTQDYARTQRWGFCPIKGEASGRVAGGWPWGGSARWVAHLTDSSEKCPHPTSIGFCIFLEGPPLDPAEWAGAGPTPDCPGGR